MNKIGIEELIKNQLDPYISLTIIKKSFSFDTFSYDKYQGIITNE